MTHWKRQRPVAKAARIKEGHGGTVGNSTMQYACNPFSLKFFYEYVPFIYNWVSYHAVAVALGRVGHYKRVLIRAYCKIVRHRLIYART